MSNNRLTMAVFIGPKSQVLPESNIWQGKATSQLKIFGKSHLLSYKLVSENWKHSKINGYCLKELTHICSETENHNSFDISLLFLAFKMFSDSYSSISNVNNVLWYCCQASLLNFPENFFSVEHIGDEYPNRCSHKVLGQVLSVGLAVGHSPTEGKVTFQHFMAHVHKDGVHAWNHTHK